VGLRIALVVPPFIRVPPSGYGGTELVAADLATALTRSGHDVTLFASGDSLIDGCETRSLFSRPLWPPEPAAERDHAVFAARAIAEGSFDIVHSHTPAFVPLARRLRVPVVHTVHHVSLPEFDCLYRAHSETSYVCISARQAELMSTAFQATPYVIHHGLDSSRYQEGSGGAGDALFLGRFDEVKAPHLAVRAAREAGLSLRLAGRPHDGDYFERVLLPELASCAVQQVGELGGDTKISALGSAQVLVFPSTWEEPFGLVLIEAMLCGTPVVALRRGAVPEIVDQGVTGMIVEAPEELGRALSIATKLDRRAVRARALSRFSAGRMASEYLRTYEEVICGGTRRLLRL
jgi:glycosyltransferase involved in cell wall biosynthesis